MEQRIEHFNSMGDLRSLAFVPLENLTSGKREVVSVCTHTTIHEAAALLQEKNILSVPVLDESNKTFIGFLDVLDLLNHTTLVHHHRQHYESLEDLQEAQFSRGLVVDILQEEGLRKLHIFGTDAKLVNLMKIMSRNIFRVLVVQKVRSGWWYGKGTFWKLQYIMLSQTDVVKYLMKHPLCGQIFGGLRVQDMEGVMAAQVTVPQGTPAIDCFLVMIDKGLHALPLVNTQGSMTGVISASDLRGISAQKFPNVISPAETFVYYMTGKVMKAPIFCYASEALWNVMQRMTAARVHQIWVVDEHGRPIGCLTMSHIIKKAWSKLPAY